jgi:hypothetical protein
MTFDGSENCSGKHHDMKHSHLEKGEINPHFNFIAGWLTSKNIH